MEVTAPPTDTVAVMEGWNLLGLPLDAPDRHYLSVFDGVPASQAYPYVIDSGYVPRDTLEHGEGFWMLFPMDTTIVSEGAPVAGLSIDVGEGWNLISGPGCAMPVAAITSDPPGLVLSAYYGFGPGGYTPESTALEPWKGYWVLIGGVGSITMACP